MRMLALVALGACTPSSGPADDADEPPGGETGTETPTDDDPSEETTADCPPVYTPPFVDHGGCTSETRSEIPDDGEVNSTSTAEYDDEGRLRETSSDFDLDGVTDSHKEYAYDDRGRLVSIRTDSDSLPLDTFYTYDDEDRVIEAVNEIDGELFQRVVYTYGPCGPVTTDTEIVLADGDTVTSRTDHRYTPTRQVSDYDGDVDGSVDSTSTLWFDALGRWDRAEQESDETHAGLEGEDHWTYDPETELVAITDGWSWLSDDFSLDWHVEYTYDRKGRETQRWSVGSSRDTTTWDCP